MSGRHPDGKGKLVPMHYAVMAMAGTPDGKSEFDKEMASAYLRLVSDTSADGQEPEYMPKVSSWQLVGGGPRSLPLSLGGGTLFGT